MYNIRCFAAFERAFKRMVIILFRPFDLAKWFFLGFCAWLATFISSQSTGMGFESPRFNAPSPKATGHTSSEFSDFIKDLFLGGGSFSGKISNYFDVPQYVIWWIIFGTLTAILVGIVVYLVFAWISCRFKFVFVENLAKNQFKISELWFKYKKLGNSAFKWFLGFFAISFIFTILGFVVIASIVYPVFLDYLRNDIFDISVSSIAVLAVAISIFFIGALILSFAFYFFNQFVIPIMYKKQISSKMAYKDLLHLLGATPFTFIKFWLLQIAANIICGIAVVLFVVCTCCIAIIPMVIPYLGTVVILPVVVFQRLQAMELLAAFGAEYSPYPVPPPRKQPQDNELAE
jgi:hypothetical protein